MLKNRKMIFSFITLLMLLGLSLAGCFLPAMSRGFYALSALVLLATFTTLGTGVIYYVFEGRTLENFCCDRDYDTLYKLTR